jgi:hypothetical protein
MDFNQLMARMRELDAPQQAATEACGDPVPPMGMTPNVPPMNDQPPPAHPSMSVNLNAQGMDNIESLLKLMTKVNPDMINQPAPPVPTLSPEPSIMSIKPPMPGIGDLGNLDAGPLKMLPDFDLDNDNKPGGEMDSDYNKDGELDPHEKDHASEKPLLKSLDLDKDGDHDMDDHDAEKSDDAEDDSEDDEENKKDEWANSPVGSSDEQKSFGSPFDKKGNDLHKSKDTFPKVAGGDNPMQKDKFRESIRAELQKRLNEAKGSK